MLYPIRQIVERDPEFPSLRCELVDGLKRYWTQSLNGVVTPEEFDQDFGLINRRLANYRKQGFNVGWIFFGQEGNLGKPDTSTQASLFDIRTEDVKLSAGFTYANYRTGVFYCDAESVLSTLPSLDDVVIGGFHNSDCVPKLAGLLKQAGVKAQTDPRLTDEIFLYSHRILEQRLARYQIDHGFLDSEMNEDNPEEMRTLFEREAVEEKLLI